MGAPSPWPSPRTRAEDERYGDAEGGEGQMGERLGQMSRSGLAPLSGPSFFPSVLSLAKTTFCGAVKGPHCDGM